MLLKNFYKADEIMVALDPTDLVFVGPQPGWRNCPENHFLVLFKDGHHLTFPFKWMDDFIKQLGITPFYYDQIPPFDMTIKDGWRDMNGQTYDCSFYNVEILNTHSDHMEAICHHSHMTPSAKSDRVCTCDNTENKHPAPTGYSILEK